MIPDERSLVKRLEGKPFALLGINSDPDREKLKQLSVKDGVSWRSWFDGSTEGPIATRWNVSGWPTLYVLDHRGVIRFKDAIGKRLDEAVDQLLEEMAAETRKSK
jgi:hypothetical protein